MINNYDAIIIIETIIIIIGALILSIGLVPLFSTEAQGNNSEKFKKYKNCAAIGAIIYIGGTIILIASALLMAS